MKTRRSSNAPCFKSIFEDKTRHAPFYSTYHLLTFLTDPESRDRRPDGPQGGEDEGQEDVGLQLRPRHGVHEVGTQAGRAVQR